MTTFSNPVQHPMKDDDGKIKFELVPPEFEERIAAVLTEKFYEQKTPRLELVDVDFIEELAEVLTYGAKKYSDNNWQNLENGIDRHYGAMRRHLAAYRKGEWLDQESKLPHLWHVATNVMFLCFHERHNPHRKGEN